MDSKTVHIVPDEASVARVLALFEDALKLPPEVLFGLFQRMELGAQLVRIHSEGFVAGRTSELRVLFEPTDVFLECFAAVRTGDGHAV